MNNLGFDSHQFVKELKKANMPEAQAEVLVKHYVSHRSQLADNVATRDDIKLVQKDIKLVQKEIEAVRADMVHTEQRLEAQIEGGEKRLEAQIEAVRADMVHTEQRLKADMVALEQRLLIKLMVLYLGGTLAVCTILGFLMAFFTGHFGS